MSSSNRLVSGLRNRWDQNVPRLCDEAADYIEELEAVLREGIEMRNLQVRYFKDRSKENLVASKQAEKSFDESARRALEGKHE